MLCVAWPWMDPWPPNSQCGCCPGAGGVGDGQGSRDALRTLCAPHCSAQLSGNGTGTPSSSAHLWGKAGPDFRDVSLGKGMCSQGHHTWERCIFPSFETFDGILFKGVDDTSVCNYSSFLLVS